MLLRFFAAQSGRSFHPFHRRPGSVARSWRGPFPRCGVAPTEAPHPDLESLPETISPSTRIGPDPRWLDGALGASNSSAPFRNRSEAFDTASPHKALSKGKYRMLFSPERRRQPGPKGPSAELIRAVVEMKQRNPNRGCPRKDSLWSMDLFRCESATLRTHWGPGRHGSIYAPDYWFRRPCRRDLPIISALVVIRQTQAATSFVRQQL